MKFNVDKCKVMHLGRGNLGGSYVMNGGTLGVVSEERDLGVRITSDLKASAHCAFVCSMANSVSGMIGRTVVFRSPDVQTRLYKSLVSPHLEYYVSAWSPQPALCEGQGKVGEGAAQVYEDGAGVEGHGV